MILVHHQEPCNPILLTFPVGVDGQSIDAYSLDNTLHLHEMTPLARVPAAVRFGAAGGSCSWSQTVTAALYTAGYTADVGAISEAAGDAGRAVRRAVLTGATSGDMLPIGAGQPLPAPHPVTPNHERKK